MKHIDEVARLVVEMDKHLRSGLLKESALWVNDNWDRRQRGDTFSTREHIRAMVYSMLSAERGWSAITENAEQIDKIFYDFNAEKIMEESPDSFIEKITGISCGNRRIKYQMAALKGNIEKLQSFEQQSGSIDTYYQKYIIADATHKTLVQTLSRGKDKLDELGVPLISEYLRHVGYDIPKPDRHTKRILGSKLLACSEHETVPDFEVFDIIAGLAEKSKILAAEVDYILWAYCADGHGEICTVRNPKCEICVAKGHCKSA